MIINKELINANSDKGDADEMINEMKMMGIELNDAKKELIRGCFGSHFLRESTILEGTQYDDKLRNWVGDYQWRLIYRASKHGYSASSFHSHCDYSEPTLIIIKSTDGWIFGGYTTQSWKVVHPNQFGCI